MCAGGGVLPRTALRENLSTAAFTEFSVGGTDKAKLAKA